MKSRLWVREMRACHWHFPSVLQVSCLFPCAVRRLAGWLCEFRIVFLGWLYVRLRQNNGIARYINCSKWTEVNSVSPHSFPPSVGFIWSFKIYYVIAQRESGSSNRQCSAHLWLLISDYVAVMCTKTRALSCDVFKFCKRTVQYFF